MGALRRIAPAGSAPAVAILGLAVAAAAAAALTLEDSASAPALAPIATVEVVASFDPPVPQFGDRIIARVVVALDTRRVRPRTLRLTDDLAPLTQLGAPRTARTTEGSLELVTVTLPVSCLTAPCVAGNGVTKIRLPLVDASVVTRDGRKLLVSAKWPVLEVRARVIASDLRARPPPLAADTAPPPATYAIAPGTLGTLLDLLAGLCALGAVALAVWEARLRVERRRRRPSALEQALVLAREAQRRPASDRRRALASLERALERDLRSAEARRLAWSRSVPEPHELERLIAEIEQERGM